MVDVVLLAVKKVKKWALLGLLHCPVRATLNLVLPVVDWHIFSEST